MHELSIVQSIVELCEQQVHQQGAQSVAWLEVSIGAMSGVEPELLQRAFDTFRAGTVCDQAQLKLIHEPLEVQCLQCSHISRPPERRYCCEHCKSTLVQALRGEHMHLQRLELQMHEKYDSSAKEN